MGPGNPPSSPSPPASSPPTGERCRCWGTLGLGFPWRSGPRSPWWLRDSPLRPEIVLLAGIAVGLGLIPALVVLGIGTESLWGSWEIGGSSMGSIQENALIFLQLGTAAFLVGTAFHTLSGGVLAGVLLAPLVALNLILLSRLGVGETLSTLGSGALILLGDGAGRRPPPAHSSGPPSPPRCANPRPSRGRRPLHHPGGLMTKHSLGAQTLHLLAKDWRTRRALYLGFLGVLAMNLLTPFGFSVAMGMGAVLFLFLGGAVLASLLLGAVVQDDAPLGAGARWRALPIRRDAVILAKGATGLLIILAMVLEGLRWLLLHRAPMGDALPFLARVVGGWGIYLLLPAGLALVTRNLRQFVLALIVAHLILGFVTPLFDRGLPPEIRRPAVGEPVDGMHLQGAEVAHLIARGGNERLPRPEAVVSLQLRIPDGPYAHVLVSPVLSLVPEGGDPIPGTPLPHALPLRAGVPLPGDSVTWLEPPTSPGDVAVSVYFRIPSRAVLPLRERGGRATLEGEVEVLRASHRLRLGADDQVAAGGGIPVARIPLTWDEPHRIFRGARLTWHTGIRESAMTTNLTITVDDEALRRARIRALEQNTSVNAVLRDFLEAYAGVRKDHADAAERILALAGESPGHRGDARWTRDELHRRGV